MDPAVSDTDSLNQLKVKGHKLSPTCVCIDSKNQFAFTGSKDGSLIKWCLGSRKVIIKINSVNRKVYESDESVRKNHHTRHVNCIAISSDDRYIATGGWDKLIRIWSPKDMTWIHTFKMHRQEVTALAFRQGHPMLYSGSADRSVMLWTLEDDDNPCYVEALYGHESAITSIDVLRRERVLTSGGRDQSIRMWKIVEQAQTVFESKHESVDVVKFIDDKTFVSGGEDGSISVWTTLKRRPVFTLKDAHPHLRDCTTEGVNKEILCPWISAIATYSLSKTDKLKKGKRQKLENGDVLVADYDDEDQEDGGTDEDEDCDGSLENNDKNIIALLATGSCNSELRIWQLLKKGSQYELILQQTIDCPGFINDLRFSSDSKRIIAACGQEHKFGRWWRLKSSKNCLRVFDLNKV